MITHEEDVKRIVRVTVVETLLTMGANIATPDAVQELQRDFQYLRDSRIDRHTLWRHGRVSLIAAVVAGACNVLWLAIQNTFNIR